MNSNASLILIIIGCVTLVGNGIFGLSSKYGRRRWLVERFGPMTARVVSIIVSLLIIGFGVLMLLRPDLFPNK